MNGHVFTHLMLTCVGNHFLRGGDLAGFWPGSDAFRFTGACDFRMPPDSGKDADDYPLVAADPMQWLQGLKPRTRGFRLHHTERMRAANQQLGVSDRMLAGMVGGGQRWLIEVVGERGSELWEGFERLGDRNAPDRKIWLWTFIRQGEASTPELDADVAALPLDRAVAQFHDALTRIEAYARAEDHGNFAEVFRGALADLDKGEGAADWINLDHTGLNQRQASILTATSRASVFGGMGSWNDLGGGDAYDKVSQDLYATLNDCIMALGNSTFAM